MEKPEYGIFQFNPYSWAVGKTVWISDYKLTRYLEPRDVVVNWLSKNGQKPYGAKLLLARGKINSQFLLINNNHSTILQR